MIYEKYDKSHISDNYEYCVIGFGPSAVILITQLLSMGVSSICVIESGGKIRNPNQRSLQKLQVSSKKIKEESRERIIGGATETWTGQYAVMDSIDFISRENCVADSIEWPLGFSDLEPFYKVVSEDYGLVNYDTFFQNEPGFVESNLFGLTSGGTLEYKKFILDLPAQQFGKDYLYIFNELGIDIFLNTTAVCIDTDQSNAAHSVSAITNDKKNFSFRGSKIIVASGAIENARILLNSKNNDGHILGNEHDQVGRYFMNRLKGMSGIIKLNSKLDLKKESIFRFYRDRFEGYYGVRFTDYIQNKEGLYNNYCMLLPWYPWYESKSYMSVVSNLQNCKKALFEFRFQPTKSNCRNFINTLFKSTFVLCTTPLFWFFLVKKILAGGSKTNLIQLRNFIEIQPHKDNRVSMSMELDTNGVPIPLVDYDFRSGELDNMKLLHKQIDRELQNNFLGNLTVEEDSYRSIFEDSSHHLGTTRMGCDIKKSVVNSDLQVHTVPGLYMLGGSVFPSSGIANPTYTMMALSARLAKHLYET